MKTITVREPQFQLEPELVLSYTRYPYQPLWRQAKYLWIASRELFSQVRINYRVIKRVTEHTP